MVDKAAQNLIESLLATKRDSLRAWWSKFDQVKQLSELMGHPLSALVDDFVHNAPADPRNNQALGFEEYLVHRAVSEIPDLLRLCPRPFFDLMDVAELMEGRRETRSKASWMKMAPLLFPLAGTEGVAAIVFDELVKDQVVEETVGDGDSASDTRAASGELTFKRFEDYIDALCKAEFETNYAEHWSVIKEQCGLVATEKCVLHTPYAADCSQFPPAVGSLYLSSEHLVFQDPVLHNRRVISLSTVIDVKKVPVELRHAKLLLTQIPGLGLFARGGVLGGLARLAGFQPAKSESAALPDAGSPAPSKRTARLRDAASDDGQSSEGGGGGGRRAAEDDAGLGLSAVLVRWQGGGSAKFMFVEVSGLLLTLWLRHLQELVLAHKLSFSRASRSINMFESCPWLPAFAAENLQRAQALESLLGREVPQLLLCTQNSSAAEPDHEGGKLVRELYVSYGAAQRYQRLEDTERNLDIFNLKTFDQNLAMLEDLSADILLALKDLDSLTTWERPVYSSAALAASLTVFYYDALSLIIPGAMLGVAARLAFQGVVKMVSKRRNPILKDESNGSLEVEDGEEEEGAEGGGEEGEGGEGRDGGEYEGVGGGEVMTSGASRGITEGSLRRVSASRGRRSSAGVESQHTRSIEADSDHSVSGASAADRSPPASPAEAASPTGDVEPTEQTVVVAAEAAAASDKGWLRRMGETVVSVRQFRSNLRKLLQENLIQVEKHLQVGLQVGREKTQKLSQLQNTVQSVNRILAKLAILHSWKYPRQSCNYVLVVATTGTFLALIPPRWLFLAGVIGKFSPGDTMLRRVQGVAISLSKRYLDPPSDDPTPDSPIPAVRAS